MVEPLSIVAFVLGSLSFIVTVRNSVERILLDADAYKNHSDILVPLSCRVHLLLIQIEAWQTFWHVQDGTPDDLFISYWSKDGSGKIRELLSHIQSHFEKVEAEFLSKYGDVLQDIVRRRQHNLSTGSFTRGMSRVRKLNTALFTGSVFYKHLESLEKSVKLLQDISENLFVKNVCGGREVDWKDHVDYAAAKVHLTQLADHSSIASHALQDLVDGSEDHKIDFYLDHGASPDQRYIEIVEFARKRHISYYLHVLPRHASPNMSALRVRCQEANFPSSSNIGWNQNLQHALQELHYGENNPGGLRAYVRIAENTPGFVLSRQYLPQQDLKNLRTFMVSTHSDFARNLHGVFSKQERTRLAYELAECALLFLRTEWLSELCSCCIYRLESRDLKTVFTLRVNRLHHAEHVDPETGQSCDLLQWCEQELRSMHIRRLGVLLTEIATGTPIFEVAFNERENEVEIDFDLGLSQTGTTRAARFKDILRRVRRESSEDFMDAVGYCLQQGTMPEDVAHADLESFYDHVVAPLYLHYNEEIVKPALRRQKRKQEKKSRTRG